MTARRGVLLLVAVVVVAVAAVVVFGQPAADSRDVEVARSVVIHAGVPTAVHPGPAWETSG